MNTALWVLAVTYVVSGLLWGGFIAIFASGQGAPLSWGRFAVQTLTWPYQAWVIFGPRR